MDLALTEDESADLRALLEGALGDLRMEIADTDNPAFRRGLDARRTNLESVLAKLSGAR